MLVLLPCSPPIPPCPAGSSGGEAPSCRIKWPVDCTTMEVAVGMLVWRQLCDSREYDQSWWENILAMLCIRNHTANLH